MSCRPRAWPRLPPHPRQAARRARQPSADDPAERADDRLYRHARQRAPGPAVLLRGDMDALPIERGRPSSTSPAGRGMDARLRPRHPYRRCSRRPRASFAHAATVRRPHRLHVQPGEEGHGGARIMLEEGLLAIRSPTLPSRCISGRRCRTGSSPAAPARCWRRQHVEARIVGGSHAASRTTRRSRSGGGGVVLALQIRGCGRTPVPTRSSCRSPRSRADTHTRPSRLVRPARHAPPLVARARARAASVRTNFALTSPLRTLHCRSRSIPLPADVKHPAPARWCENRGRCYQELGASTWARTSALARARAGAMAFLGVASPARTQASVRRSTNIRE